MTVIEIDTEAFRIFVSEKASPDRTYPSSLGVAF